MRTKQKIQEQIPQAPRAPLPELAEFLGPLRVQFTQGPSGETLRQHLTGLLSEHPNKNCDTLAKIVPETTPQQFQHLLMDIVWDETALIRLRIAQIQTLASEGDGVLIFDDTGFEKKGRHSVGVTRQHTGTGGKLTNCQVTFNGHFSGLAGVVEAGAAYRARAATSRFFPTPGPSPPAAPGGPSPGERMASKEGDP